MLTPHSQSLLPCQLCHWNFDASLKLRHNTLYTLATVIDGWLADAIALADMATPAAASLLRYAGGWPATLEMGFHGCSGHSRWGWAAEALMPAGRLPQIGWWCRWLAGCHVRCWCCRLILPRLDDAIPAHYAYYDTLFRHIEAFIRRFTAITMLLATARWCWLLAAAMFFSCCWLHGWCLSADRLRYYATYCIARHDEFAAHIQLLPLPADSWYTAPLISPADLPPAAADDAITLRCHW